MKMNDKRLKMIQQSAPNVSKTEVDQPVKKRKKSLDKWSSNDFIKYFHELKPTMSVRDINNMKILGLMRIVKDNINNNEVLKQLIEFYINDGVIENPNISNFCTNAIQEALMYRYENGVYPDWLLKKARKSFNHQPPPVEEKVNEPVYEEPVIIQPVQKKRKLRPGEYKDRKCNTLEQSQWHLKAFRRWQNIFKDYVRRKYKPSEDDPDYEQKYDRWGIKESFIMNAEPPLRCKMAIEHEKREAYQKLKEGVNVKPYNKSKDKKNSYSIFDVKGATHTRDVVDEILEILDKRSQ